MQNANAPIMISIQCQQLQIDIGVLSQPDFRRSAIHSGDPITHRRIPENSPNAFGVEAPIKRWRQVTWIKNQAKTDGPLSKR